MKPSELDACPSFALLGPGFGAGRWRLLRDLRTATGSERALVFAPFERPGSVPEVWAAASVVETVDLELEPPAGPLDVRLESRGYAHQIATIRQAIARGDVYQVCLTLRASLPPVSGAALFATLAARGPAPFAAWVRLPNGPEFVSASPELFFEVRSGAVHTQPMKGTGRAEAADALRASEKDRAELAMITDLLRNDLTPICRPRSVRVASDRRFLHLPYAVQTVSDIVGELDEKRTPLDVLAALHPGGSVTGAPKGAALAMIRALEPTPRGAYCGALGWMDRAEATFSLLIRTATRTPQGWTYGVGSGVVFESEADAELAELEVKLSALGG